jgi:hypothetical protein
MIFEQRVTSPEPSTPVTDCDLEHCEQLEAIEELALFGPLGGVARTAAATAHLESCAACREEYELLRAERTLFERRETVISEPASLEADVSRAVASAAEARSARRATLASATRVSFALAACVTALLGQGFFDRAAPAAAKAASPMDVITTTSSFDEPLACALPVSGFVSPHDVGGACAVRGVDEGLASTIPGHDREICEERVTSSVATP